MIKSVSDLDIKNKVVLLRVDFNVPLKDGKIVNDARIRSAIPTIEYIVNNNAKLVILSHLGRIKSIDDINKNSLEVVATRLQELINKKVNFVNATRGNEVENAISQLNCGEIIMLQNTRYEDFDVIKNTEIKLESKNDSELSKYWASLGDVFVNDAFAVSHRECASISGIATYIKEKCSGFLLQKEIEIGEKLINNISKPYIAILGGSKVADKIGVFNTLIEKADRILVGGAMMFTFLKAQGINVGASKCEDDEYVSFAKEILKNSSGKIVLPVDVVCNSKFEDTLGYEKDINSISNLDIGLDIGKNTIELFKKELINAKTIVWNGPMGVFEMENYCIGTKEICKILSDLTFKGATTIVGGGETVSAVEKFGFNNITHISTGGGAFLEMLEGKSLPGIEVLKNN